MTEKILIKRICSFIIVIMYFAIVIYSLFNVVNITSKDSWLWTIVFEIIGAIIFIFYIIRVMDSKVIKFGYKVSLGLRVIAYNVIVVIQNIFQIRYPNIAVFIMLQLITLFVFFIISMPMYIIGKK